MPEGLAGAPTCSLDFLQGRQGVDTASRRHPAFGLSLPLKMVEKATGDDGQWVDGECSYSNFRRFETSGRMLLPK